MDPTEIRQEVFTFAEAQQSAGDIDAMRIQLRILEDECDELARKHKESVEYTDLQQCKDSIKDLREQIAQASGALISGLVGK